MIHKEHDIRDYHIDFLNAVYQCQGHVYNYDGESVMEIGDLIGQVKAMARATNNDTPQMRGLIAYIEALNHLNKSKSRG